MVSFKYVYSVMMQNVFLTANLVKKFENPCIESILIGCVLPLIL